MVCPLIVIIRHLAFRFVSCRFSLCFLFSGNNKENFATCKLGKENLFNCCVVVQPCKYMVNCYSVYILFMCFDIVEH